MAGSNQTKRRPGSSGSAAVADAVSSVDGQTGAVVLTDEYQALGLGLQTATVDTSETTASTSFTDLATSGPAATVTTRTSALVFIAANLSNNTDASLMSMAVSGASTVAAADTKAIRHGGSATIDSEAGTFFVVTGLTAGSNTFTAKYRVNAGTGTFRNRRIAVIPL